jgi:biofilm PGA synthesis N-glycosyltransferase PgaC
MELIFWTSLGVILYVYVGYPLLLVIIALRARPTRRDESYLPFVSLIIAAYNEEKVLREKIDNSLALDYPRDLIEIVIASDGSTDATNAIAESYADRGIILYKVIPRGGKTRALNTVIPKTRGEILVLSDANTMFRADAIRKLVRHFVDPTVGAVSGDVRLVDAAESHAHSEGLYYRYERWLQGLESQVGSVIGADGGMYAIARKCFHAPSDRVLVDDFVISMTVARLGYRVLYDPETVAVEQGTLSSAEEFRRKIRVVGGGIQALLLREGLPTLKQPVFIFCYISHKILRWVVPCFLVALFLSSLFLHRQQIYFLALAGQGFFYSIAAAYAVDRLGIRRFKRIGIPYYFCLVNGAALIGLWRAISNTHTVMWERTIR